MGAAHRSNISSIVKSSNSPSSRASWARERISDENEPLILAMVPDRLKLVMELRKTTKSMVRRIGKWHKHCYRSRNFEGVNLCAEDRNDCEASINCFGRWKVFFEERPSRGPRVRDVAISEFEVSSSNTLFVTPTPTWKVSPAVPNFSPATVISSDSSDTAFPFRAMGLGERASVAGLREEFASPHRSAAVPLSMSSGAVLFPSPSGCTEARSHGWTCWFGSHRFRLTWPSLTCRVSGPRMSELLGTGARNTPN
jgi:hypothetical protein